MWNKILFVAVFNWFKINFDVFLHLEMMKKLNMQLKQMTEKKEIKSFFIYEHFDRMPIELSMKSWKLYEIRLNT